MNWRRGWPGANRPGRTRWTSARVLGSLLSWMQEKTAPVFVVATANDVSQIAAGLLRKGRLCRVPDYAGLKEREAFEALCHSKFPLLERSYNHPA